LVLKETGIIWSHLQKVGSKWIVNLRPPKPNRNKEDEAWDESAQTTFNMYFRTLFFEAWDEENEYDSWLRTALERQPVALVRPCFEEKGSEEHVECRLS
jgi:hypothetical protein